MYILRIYGLSDFFFPNSKKPKKIKPLYHRPLLANKKLMKRWVHIKTSNNLSSKIFVVKLLLKYVWYDSPFGS